MEHEYLFNKTDIATGIGYCSSSFASASVHMHVTTDPHGRYLVDLSLSGTISSAGCIDRWPDCILAVTEYCVVYR